jgi:hypothetical protein
VPDVPAKDWLDVPVSVSEDLTVPFEDCET